MEEVKKQIKQRTAKLKADIQAGVGEKITFYTCEHIDRGELPARVGIYISTKKRVLLCKPCAHLAASTIQEFFTTEYERDKLIGAIREAKDAVKETRYILEAAKRKNIQKWWQFWRK